MAADKSFMDDRESLEALVDLLPPAERAEYRSYQCLGLESGFPGRRLVIYTLQGGRPSDIEILNLGELSMGPREGPVVRVMSDKGPDTLVGMVPKRVRDRELYLHVPQKFEFKWKGKRSARDGVNFAPHYALLMKTRSKPHMRVEGHTYCVRLNQFWEMFPGLDVGY